MKRKAIFLDRDGVINRAVIRNGRPFAPTSLAEFVIEPGSVRAIDRLRALDYFLVIATNQPDVANGVINRLLVEEMHARIQREIPIDSFKVCYHIDSDVCFCRKPKPGLLLDAAQEFNIDLSQSFMIGDRWRDIEAGKAAGCRTVHIDYGYMEKRPEKPDKTVTSLVGAVEYIMQYNL